MAARALADPQAHRSVRTIAQFVDCQGGRACAIHKDAHFRPLDNDASVKPLIAVRLGNDGLFILVRVLCSERLPGPARMGGVLHCMLMAYRVGRTNFPVTAPRPARRSTAAQRERRILFSLCASSALSLTPRLYAVHPSRRLRLLTRAAPIQGTTVRPLTQLADAGLVFRATTRRRMGTGDA
jgi:hypothetical protein